MPLLCVYASSSDEIAVAHFELAEALGLRAAMAGWNLIFGGARVGLMNAVARGFRAGGARVAAIVPRVFDRSDLVWSDAEELHVTLDLRERKRMMQERADAFCVLPGGPGTLDEFWETLTLRQLRLLDAPILLVDHLGHFAATRAQLETLVRDGFATRDLLGMVTVAEGLEDAAGALEAWARRPGPPSER